MDRRKAKTVDVFFSILVLLIMSYFDILTLNNILFGEGEIYDTTKDVLLIFIVVLLIIARKRLLVLKKDSVFVFIVVSLLFFIILLISPASTEVIIAEKLYRGVYFAIFGYALIRKVKNYPVFFNVMAVFASIMILYGCIILYFVEIDRAYMGFAYALLVYVLFMNYNWLFRKSKVSAVFAVVGIIIELIGGARGAIICITFFIGMYFVSRVKRKRNLVIILAILLIVPWLDSLLLVLNDVFSILGVESRTISAIQGTGLESLSYANGRIEIFEASIELIKANPFGYGFLGERAPLNNEIWWFTTNGYSHNVFVELVLQFGVVIGTFLGIVLVAAIIRVIRIGKFQLQYNGLFLVFLSYNLSLLVSRSYSTSFQFWAMLSLMYMILKQDSYANKQNMGV